MPSLYSLCKIKMLFKYFVLCNCYEINFLYCIKIKVLLLHSCLYIWQMLLSIAFKVQYALYQFMHFLGIKPMTLALFEPRFPGNSWTVALDCALLNTWGRNGALFANVLCNIHIFRTFSGNQTHDFGIIRTKIPRKCISCWAEILFSWTHVLLVPRS